MKINSSEWLMYLKKIPQVINGLGNQVGMTRGSQNGQLREKSLTTITHIYKCLVCFESISKACLCRLFVLRALATIISIVFYNLICNNLTFCTAL